MSLSDIREERIGQVSAIEITLATAPDIQEDLKAKFGYGENIFFDLDLIEYRINNSALDIAEDLDVKSLYGLTTDEVARNSVGSAFRGHHDEEFMPNYQFNGLFSEAINDMIEKSRDSINGRKGGLIGGLIGGRKIASMINPETGVRYLVEAARKSNEAQGKHVWSLEEIVDIHNFREDSIGKGRYKTLPSLDYVRDKMNEKYDKDWSTSQVKKAYFQNKHLLSDEEE